jgi:SAM-dependent methyltransferase
MEDVNRRYFVDYVSRVAPPGATVLDFGCGDGTLVRMLCDAGYEAYGVDIRWPGADYGDLADSDLGRAGLLRYYEEGGALPFDDGFFDVVVSDQVLEHVRPLEATVRELERIGRLSYHHFPSRAVWREGHIGIPFAHRLPPGRARLAYTTALRRLGLGTAKDERPARQWAREMLDWIDRWTVYRDVRDVEAALGGEIRHRELEYCRFRAGDRWRPLLSRRRTVEAVFRRLGFEAIEVRPAPDPPRAP